MCYLSCFVWHYCIFSYFDTTREKTLQKKQTIKVTWFPVFRLSIFLLTSCTAGFHSIFLEAPSLWCWQQHVRSKLVVGFAVLWTIGHMCCIFVCSPKLNCYQTLTTGAKGGCLIKETWDLKFLHNLWDQINVIELNRRKFGQLHRTQNMEQWTEDLDIRRTIISTSIANNRNSITLLALHYLNLLLSIPLRPSQEARPPPVELHSSAPFIFFPLRVSSRSFASDLVFVKTQ